MATKRGRDARTGQFIPVKVAEQRKSTAVVETVKPKKKRKAKRQPDLGFQRAAGTSVLVARSPQLIQPEQIFQTKGGFFGEKVSEDFNLSKITCPALFIEEISAWIRYALPRHGDSPICKRR
jgi:hypothetical protein